MKLNEIKQLNENTFLTDHEEIKDWLATHTNLYSNEYTIDTNGVVNTNTSVEIFDDHITEFGVQFGYIEGGNGNFTIQCRELTSLAGCPTNVKGTLSINAPKLISLEGCAKHVGKHFDLNRCNTLKNLKGGPTEVGNSYIIDKCENIESLEGCAKIVYEDLSCTGLVNLKTLQYAPISVSQIFSLDNCGISTFEHSPESVGYLKVWDCKNLTTFLGAPKRVAHFVSINETPIYSLLGISDIFESIGGNFHIDELHEGGLGLILISNLKSVGFTIDHGEVAKIISKYLRKPDEIFDCQNELIEAGLDHIAQL